MDFEGDARNSSSPEEKNPKRRMKSRFQLEALERVYAEDRYPTEAVRAELSLHLNLSDKQLQMWFCHRRLKDRKGEDDESGQGGAAAARKKAKTDRSASAFEGHYQQGPVLETYNLLDPPGNRNRTDASHDEFDEENYRGMMQGGSSGAHFRKSVSVHEAEMPPPKRSHLQGGRVPSPRIAAEIAAVAAVEARLGKHLRSDGPPLGVHFDPLPSPPLQDFLGVEKKLPAAVPQQHYVEKPPVERQDVRPSKVGGFGLPPLPTAAVMTPKGVGLPVQQNVNAQHLSRPPREFQFLPEHHSVKGDAYRKPIPFNLHSNMGRPYDLLPDTRVRSLSPLRSFLPSSNMPLTLGDGYCLPRERVQNVAISLALPGQGRSSGTYTPLGIDTEIQQPGLYHNFELGGQNGVCQSALQGIGSSQPPFGGSDSLALFQEQERVRAEKKRKIEEMKVAKESEANMKRIKRDLERQEIVRRKKEEQMKRDAEKLDREKKKEEERILREKQREEERLEREQKREQGRQEKMVLKENRKMEKQQRKEELRKAKEAARLKALSEKAAAKKLTKESMDTIDDEQLELLEAATAQGLLSGNGLEDGDRQDMDLSNVILKEFPPTVVRMKVPMSGYPWAELEHTVGDFFMVWRFLTTFADVIGLWSFTLDEFAQALYDHDPRLLGEIHVSLIKMLVKNIEDAAQAAASGAVGSQNAIALASGGHPQIVEAAFEWGFDIREWGHYVNPVTWPEILRQFALAAGYGPKWRTSDKETPPVKEEVEERSEENAVKILRSGAAAASAVALMQGKGVGNLRRGRYRLTPGTVKYAAFHILSLEGAKGLTILDVAEKIQKSGLRDLKTSKTPEASIAAALSRDMNLFERVAPSTYCVRPAFRKDLDDTEEVLQAARERIRLFQSGFLDVEEAEKETDEAEDVERDEDYDSDGQDVEDGDLAAQLSKDADVKDEILAKQALHANSATEEGMEIDESQGGEPWVQGLMEGDYSDLSVEERLMALVALVNVVNEGHGIRQALETRMEAASALKRQLWTETQLERRRHKEEQLSRLQPALLAAKNEGGDFSLAIGAAPSPIVTPEKPSELVAKAKDENFLDLSLVPIDPPPDTMSTVEQSLLQEKILPTDEKNIIFQEGLGPQENVAAGLITERPRVQLKTNTGIQAEELYLIRSFPLGLDRRRNRYWQFSACTGGQDPSLGRIYFESSSDGHWGVVDNEESLDALMTALDVRGTREAGLHAVLGRLESSLRPAMRASASSPSSRESGTDAASEAVGPGRDVDSVGGSDGSGVLHSTALGSSPPRGLGLKFLEEPGAIVVNLGKTDADKRGLFQHFKDFEQWMWSEQSRTLSGWRVAKPGRKREPDLLSLCVKCHDLYWTSEKYCQFCYSSNPKTQGKQDLRARESDERMKRDPSTLVPPRVQILKADIVSIEALLPLDAFKDPWDQQHRKAWALSIKSAREPHELLQAVTELEIRVKPDWLSAYYTNKEALSARASSKLTTNSQGHPWLPHTSAAVGLHVLAFGAALACSTEEKKKKQKAEEEEQDPSIGVPASQTTSDLPATDDQVNEEDGGTSKDVTETRGGRGRGRGGRKGLGGIRSSRTSSGRGGAKKGSKSKPVQEERTVAVTTTEVKQGGKGGGRGQGGRSRSLSRSRPRGRSTGRARGRGSRGGRSHLSAGRKDKAPKEKNPNELMSGEATLAKALEQPPAPEEEDEGVSKSEWEESEDKFEVPQEMEEDENTGGIVEDDGDEDAHLDEADGDVEVLPEASDAEEDEEDEEQQEEADAEEEEHQEEADGDEEEHPEEEADVDEEEHQEEADGDEEEHEMEADGDEEDHQEEADGDEEELTVEGDGDEEELPTQGDGDEEELPVKGDGDEEELPTEGDGHEEELPSMTEGDDVELTQEADLDDEEAAEEVGEGADEDGGADFDEENANRAEKGDGLGLTVERRQDEDEELGGSHPP